MLQNLSNYELNGGFARIRASRNKTLVRDDQYKKGFRKTNSLPPLRIIVINMPLKESILVLCRCVWVTIQVSMTEFFKAVNFQFSFCLTWHSIHSSH